MFKTNQCKKDFLTSSVTEQYNCVVCRVRVGVFANPALFMATENPWKADIIHGYTRECARKHENQVPNDIISVILLFYTPWNELSPHQTPAIAKQPISINSSIWYSTRCYAGEKGMVQYNNTTNKIENIIKYPHDIKPAGHSCCIHKNKIYIINGWKGEIILFEPATGKFTKKLTTSALGQSTSCVVMDDDIHIYNGYGANKYLIYSITNNTIKILNDATTTKQVGGVYFISYTGKVLKFGGRDVSGKDAMDFYESSEINGEEMDDIKWTLREEFEVKHGLTSGGYVLFEDYVITFGGDRAVPGDDNSDIDVSDDIYVLNLKKSEGWIKMKHIKCPLGSQYRAVLDEDENVHLFTRFNKWPNWQESDIKHYSSPVKQVLGQLIS